jgi:uncharacterized flavoprotein (TIGR03862 family)
MTATPKHIAIIGGGPTGLMAAEILANAGQLVTIYDRMPSLGRKFLMAGRGGLNITHSEPLETFITRYAGASQWLAPHIQSFSPDALQAWCKNLGQELFVGSSGRVFPRDMKASTLLRAWLTRLNGLGVQYAARHYWRGWKEGALHFTNALGSDMFVTPDATLLALGGASWPRLGSDGSWYTILSEAKVALSPLRPANCGFVVPWSTHMSRFAGQPLKPVTLTHHGVSQQGEAMITQAGLEGGVVYALSASIRDAIESEGYTTIHLDVRPTMSLEALTKKLETPRASKSLSTYLRQCGFSPLAVALLREVTGAQELSTFSANALAQRFKSLPVQLTAATGMLHAISSAGGVRRDAVDDRFMLRNKTGVFVAGEMLDWEAPTGGYLLQGCFSTSVAAAQGMLDFLEKTK